MTINSGFSHKKWGFSIATLNYQRVYQIRWGLTKDGEANKEELATAQEQLLMIWPWDWGTLLENVLLTCGWHSIKSCQLHVSAGILCVLQWLPWLISSSPARLQIVIAGLHALAALETWSTGQTGPSAKSSWQQPDFTTFGRVSSIKFIGHGR